MARLINKVNHKSILAVGNNCWQSGSRCPEPFVFYTEVKGEEMSFEFKEYEQWWGNIKKEPFITFSSSVCDQLFVMSFTDILREVSRLDMPFLCSATLIDENEDHVTSFVMDYDPDESKRKMISVIMLDIINDKASGSACVNLGFDDKGCITKHVSLSRIKRTKPRLQWNAFINKLKDSYCELACQCVAYAMAKMAGTLRVDNVLNTPDIPKEERKTQPYGNYTGITLGNVTSLWGESTSFCSYIKGLRESVTKSLERREELKNIKKDKDMKEDVYCFDKNPDDSCSNEREVVIDGYAVHTKVKEITDINILECEYGTNTPKGGDTGHGGRTYFRISDLGGTDIRARIINPCENIFTDINGNILYYCDGIEIALGGDAENETFLKALRFASSNEYEGINECDVVKWMTAVVPVRFENTEEVKEYMKRDFDWYDAHPDAEIGVAMDCSVECAQMLSMLKSVFSPLPVESKSYKAISKAFHNGKNETLFIGARKDVVMVPNDMPYENRIIDTETKMGIATVYVVHYKTGLTYFLSNSKDALKPYVQRSL